MTSRDGRVSSTTYNAQMQTSPPPFYQRYQPWRRGVEVGYWVVQYLVSALTNSITVTMDVERAQLGFKAWQPVVWETSSAVIGLVLVPAVVWFTRRFPLHLDTWRRVLPIHLVGSLLWSILHVLGMVALRKLAYASIGDHYDFGSWWREFGYEYLKDVRRITGAECGDGSSHSLVVAPLEDRHHLVVLLARVVIFSEVVDPFAQRATHRMPPLDLSLRLDRCRRECAEHQRGARCNS